VRLQRAAPVAARTAGAEPLAGALAHDFNNLMTVILAASGELADGAAEGSRQAELAKVCLQAAERGAELLERLVSASRPKPAATLDGRGLIETVVAFVRQAAPADIRLEISGEAVGCAGDAAGLESALLNLCFNAIDAMPEGGLLALDAREVTLSAAAAERIGLAPGRYARISVSDTGTGMAPDVMASALEPYFTTKGDAGTGLGLASARAAARAAGGALSLASAPDEGTTACLYLPRAGEPVRGLG
jgi:signal transduction histidine kinase